MIEILQEDLADNVIGIKASGQVTKEDYKNILIPAIEKALQQKDKIRVLYFAGDDFQGMDFGAMWEDLTFGVGHWSNWEKVAVVTDISWMSNTINAFSFMMPCPVKVFTNNQSSEAKSWITSQE